MAHYRNKWVWLKYLLLSISCCIHRATLQQMFFLNKITELLWPQSYCKYLFMQLILVKATLKEELTLCALREIDFLGISTRFSRHVHLFRKWFCSICLVCQGHQKSGSSLGSSHMGEATGLAARRQTDINMGVACCSLPQTLPKPQETQKFPSEGKKN